MKITRVVLNFFLIIFFLFLVRSNIYSQEFYLEISPGKILKNENYHSGWDLSLNTKYFINDYVGAGASFGFHVFKIKNKEFFSYGAAIFSSELVAVGRLKLEYLNLVSTIGYGYYKFVEIESDFVRFPDMNTKRLSKSLEDTGNINYSIGVESNIFTFLKMGISYKLIPFHTTISSKLQNVTTGELYIVKEDVSLPLSLIQLVVGFEL